MISLNLLYKKSCQLLQISIYTQLRSKFLQFTYTLILGALTASPTQLRRIALLQV